MLQYLKNEANLTHTENGAVTYQSTQSECLDLFATIGALRRESDEEITNRFLRAYAENADLAMKTLFFARDIRGGIGERRVFRTILKWLAHNEPQSVEKNIPYIAEYTAFMNRVTEGVEQIHTGTLTPYEIIAPFFKRDIRTEERKAIDVTWNAQEDFTGGENALVVIDGSGSMYGGSDPIPATVALSLGIYYAERNTGAFHNHFITFSENPRLVEIEGKDILEKVRYCHQFNEVANTNIQRVFELVLKAAVKNHVPQEEMPSKIFIISDMEFDYCTEDCSLTNFEYAQKLFSEHGYRLPDLVFWNVNSRNRQQPVSVNDQGVALVSGCNARIFSMLKSGILSPFALMMDVLGSERYAAIVA